MTENTIIYPIGYVATSPKVPLADQVRAERDRRIQEQTWRYERHARQLRLGLEPTDDIAALDAYIQALADVPQQSGFPSEIVWPELQNNKD